jgi:hypothetical protein
MPPAIDQFRANILRVRNLGTLHTAIAARTTPALDLSDILRAELVMAVSALDHFVHEISRIGMIEAHTGVRVRTRAFQSFSVSIESVHEALADMANITWLDEEIRLRHGWKSFQQPDHIAEAVRLISDVNLWDEVGCRMAIPAKDVKQQLRLIIDRRNKIAHEADIDPSFPDRRWPIDEILVKEAVVFIETVAETIFQVI